MALHSGFPREGNSRNHAARARPLEITRPNEQKPLQGLEAKPGPVALETMYPFVDSGV